MTARWGTNVYAGASAVLAYHELRVSWMRRRETLFQTMSGAEGVTWSPGWRVLFGRMPAS